MKGRGKLSPFSQPIAKPKLVGPEHSLWYWNPNRVGAGEAPAWFRAKLSEVDPDGMVDFRWNPIVERWVAFYRNWKVAQPVCMGWQVLFKVEDPVDGTYMPLDERSLATLYNASARRWGNGRDYFLAIEREMERDKDRREKAQTQEAIDRAMPTYDHSQISVSMRGKSNGSKFSTYHS